MFSFICWAAPNNVPVNQLFGVYSGLGMSVLTFDWTQISWIGSPLMGMSSHEPSVCGTDSPAVPWWAQVHVFLGFVLFFWILTPALYYSNVGTDFPDRVIDRSNFFHSLVVVSCLLPDLGKRAV